MIRLYESVRRTIPHASYCLLLVAFEVSLIDFEVAVADFMQSRESTRQAVNILMNPTTRHMERPHKAKVSEETVTRSRFPFKLGWALLCTANRAWVGREAEGGFVSMDRGMVLKCMESEKVKWKVKWNKWRRVRNGQRWLQWWLGMPIATAWSEFVPLFHSGSMASGYQERRLKLLAGSTFQMLSPLGCASSIIFFVRAASFAVRMSLWCRSTYDSYDM